MTLVAYLSLYFMSKPTKQKAKSPFAAAQAPEDNLAATTILPRDTIERYVESRSNPRKVQSWHTTSVKRTASHAGLGDRNEEDSDAEDHMEEDSDSDEDDDLVAAYLEKASSMQKSTTQLLLALVQWMFSQTQLNLTPSSTLQQLMKEMTSDPEMAVKSSSDTLNSN